MTDRPTRMEPTIEVRGEDPAQWSRRVAVSWPERRYAIAGDNNAAHGGDATAPDGFELMGAAYGICMVTTLIAAAQRRQTPLRRVEARVAMKARKRGAREAPYLSDFHIDIYLEGQLDEIERAELQEETATLCGVHETLRRTSRVSEHVHLGSPPA